jgi:1-acyl-sn-glycerol-3-phosphate acyltransferase
MKLFWYLYFVVYLSIESLGMMKLAYLKRKDDLEADHYAYKKVQGICKFILKKSKTDVEVQGVENIPKEPCLFVSNHQAIFDAFVIIAYIDKLTGFIAKKEIKKIPLISGWLRAIHTVYIDRENIKEGIKAINAGVEKLQQGYSMIIFPEGTRSLSSEMGDFKKGSMKLATKANVPIVPVTVDGTYRVLEVGNQVRGNRVGIRFHKPIYVESLSKDQIKELTDFTHNIIQEGLKEMINRK